MADNLALINTLFERKEDPRYADGYAYFRQNCDVECNVGEASFECQDGRTVPIYITCRYGCGRSWYLQIFPSGNIDLH